MQPNIRYGRAFFLILVINIVAILLFRVWE
jgi:hypothetical protein